MSFLFVDRILHMDEGRFIRGIKHITLSDMYLTPGEPGERWTFMPSIMGETLGQLGAWCAMHANGFKWRPVAGVVSAVHIQGQAVIGDTVLLETTIDALDDTAVEYHSVATVNGQPIFTIEHALGPMLPMEDFIDPAEVKRQFARIYRPDSNNTYNSNNIQLSSNNLSPITTHIDFDNIITWQLGECVVAQKHFSLSAPYILDHFPRKPVLPLTILLQAKLTLATRFIMASFEDGLHFKPMTVRKIKMSGFVQPGDSVITHMRIKEKTEHRIIIGYQTTLADKRVCMAEAIFEKKLT